jgi:hypothetical protein
MLQMDKRCGKWLLLQIDKCLEPAESPAEGLCRDRSAQQGGGGVCPEDKQGPHFTIMFCFNAWGMRPLPMMVVPNPVLAPAVFRAFQGYCSIASTKNGWVNGGARVEWASDFARGSTITGHVLARPNSPHYCS